MIQRGNRLSSVSGDIDKLKGREYGISLGKKEDRRHNCTIPFVPHAFLKMPSIVVNINRIVEDIELHAESPYEFKKRQS
jgi:hypothetical protein